MDFFENIVKESEAEDMGSNIVKAYKRFDINIEILEQNILSDRTIFEVKLKGKTRAAHLHARALDVQQRLKFPLFDIKEHKFRIFIVASEQEIKYPHLSKLLFHSSDTRGRSNSLPYVVGHNSVGQLVTADLVELNHLLIGGSSNSGKSVGLQALITSIAYSRSPNKVNFLMIDVGASSLLPFDQLPHLTCPIVRKADTAYRALTALKTEMERCVELEYTDADAFERLPRLVLVIDEFPSLFSGQDKHTTKLFADIISSFLQRGRHAKIHVILAAQNPTLQAMKVDLSNISARIAFRCAKRNFSETILGELGAENLLNQGDLLLKSPQCDGLQLIKGSFLTLTELQSTVRYIAADPHNRDIRRKFIIPENDLNAPKEAANLNASSFKHPIPRKSAVEDMLFASIVRWALNRDMISANALMEEFDLGWNRASKFMKKLENWGIVNQLSGKLPRKVIPDKLSEVPEEIIGFLKANGISEEELFAS